MNRYQNPNIFEYLAFSYAMGTLHGKARQRFIRLMQQHFYLQALVNSYQQCLAPLDIALTPIQPSAKVWHNIRKQLHLPKETKLKRVLAFFTLSKRLPWSVATFSSILAGVLLTLLLHTPQSSGYVVAMHSPQNPNTLAVASISRQTMQINFVIPSKALTPSSKALIPTLWCYHKDKARPPVRMGVLNANQANSLALTERMWQEMASISNFVITLESNPASQQPSGVIAFKGELISL